MTRLSREPQTAQQPQPRQVPLVQLMGVGFAKLDTAGVLEEVAQALDAGRGGLLLTANLDILRLHTRSEAAREVYRQATLTVADGAPVVWASWLKGDVLPERVAGASLVPLLVARAANEGRSVYLLGGDGDDAHVAAAVFTSENPALRIVGVSSPRVGFPPSEAEVQCITEALLRASPDIVLIAMGSPKQEALANRLRRDLPRTWFVGVGASLAFAGGRIARAPALMQSLGLEWAHRLASEPRRLARRYLVDGLPFAVELFASALKDRATRARS